MPYRNKTRFYRIPAMAEGDRLTEEQEWIQMSTIDNLLFAATFGCDKAFLEEGKYSIKWNEAHNACHLVISPLKTDGFSMMGIINYRMFFSKKEQSVGTLYPGGKYYVYVEYTNNLETDPESFSIKAYLSPQIEDTSRMALCIVDIDSETIDLDVNKVYAKNILAHVIDSTNPHGSHLVQDKLDVLNEMRIGGRNLVLPEYRDFQTGGSNSLTFAFEGKKPVFATIYAESWEAGIFSWRIDGNYLIICNSGEPGIMAHVKVDFE